MGELTLIILLDSKVFPSLKLSTEVLFLLESTSVLSRNFRLVIPITIGGFENLSGEDFQNNSK